MVFVLRKRITAYPTVLYVVGALLSCKGLWYCRYRRCDELIWVKTNQLQKLIRTGRTGHWINHGKEHCLVSSNGAPT